jgi:hypothetical protein
MVERLSSTKLSPEPKENHAQEAISQEVEVIDQEEADLEEEIAIEIVVDTDKPIRFFN